MITLEQYEIIRRMYHVEHQSGRAIAQALGISRQTVAKALLTEQAPTYTLKKPREAPQLGAYKMRIDALLQDNARLPRKQRYTAHKIFQVLQAEGYSGSESSVQGYAVQWRKSHRRPATFLPLEFEPGQDAQVDWGEAQAIIAGVPRFEQVFTALQRAQAATPGAPPLNPPRFWQVCDADQGMQMRWIGLVLVIDRGLLMSRHFPPLLAHELARASSFDLFTRSLYTIFPPFRWSILTLLGLPLACGPILLHPVWMRYWRERVFAGDEYAARIGQQQALKRTLDDLRWVLDGGRATRGGRWLHETPYIEERIDRLDRYQPPVPQAVV